VIRIILGKKKTGDSDWDNCYTRAADYMKKWESEDILVRTGHPSMYLTSMGYDPGDGGGKRVRWGLIALVRIEDEGSGVILPHEKTFSAHKDDRLKLMRACNSQLSQIFGLYDDSEKVVSGCIEKIQSVSPRVSFDFEDGTSHQMWVVKDSDIFRKVSQTMRDKSIFIADGHHRYETARNFRNIMRSRHGSKDNRSYEYVMMYFTDMNDAGLTILPSHRLIKKYEGFNIDTFLKKVSPWFEIKELPLYGKDRIKQVQELRSQLKEAGERATSIGFHHHNGNSFFLLSLKEAGLEAMDEDMDPSLKKLDVLVLVNLLMLRGLGFSNKDMDNDELFHYNSYMEKVISLVDSGEYEMTFLLNPTKMEHVKDVASKSLIMPRKSTYFYPKVLTGLVFNKIDPHEIIQSS
jgi:uncharacterized protein (DUF1015 family)